MKRGAIKGEIPSNGFACSARALAKIAAFMANGGTLGGTKMISEESWEKAHSNPTDDWLGKDMMKATITKGGFFYHSEQTKAGKSDMQNQFES